MSLSMPISSVTALQIEGRIYRIGQESDAIFEYPLLGLDMEVEYFGRNINRRLSTTENLAVGEQSRDLIRSFAEGVLFNSDIADPHSEQGKGGKEYDRKIQQAMSEFRRAVLVYQSNQKVRGKRDERDGIDYFATPEPVGQKMVEWLYLQPGETGMEPSAGHGAIAMWFPNHANITAIEPSFKLYSKLNARSGGGEKKVINSTFEEHNIVNKYHGIAMNPPFGSGGKTAMDHVEKAFHHLKDGGRLIAIIPNGPSMTKRLDNFLYGEDEKGRQLNPEAYLIGEIQLPSSAFEQAGTTVSSRIVIIERHISAPDNLRTGIKRDLSDVKNVNELFDRIEDISMPERVKQGERPRTDTIGLVNKIADGINEGNQGEYPGYEVFEQKDTRDGSALYMTKPTVLLDKEQYRKVADAAKRYDGYWSRYENKAQGIKAGFLFKSEENRTKFLNQVSGNETPKFRLIGETGAANLDKAEEATTRLDNLDIAREMEQAGKDVKSIRLATGWEKGVDGKWRYEVDDSNFVVHLPNDITNGSTFILSDIVLYDELFNAYPDYKNINIIFLEDENFRPNSAQYIHSANTVVFYNFQLQDSEGNVDSSDSFKGTLLHEIQHSIQENEGFAVGTNPENALGNYISQYISRKRGIDGKSKNSLSGITAEEYIEAVNQAKKETGTNSNNEAALELYKRSAGEVESRNVQTRMNMTPEERLNTLLSETEDVAREDQIVLMEGLGVSSLSPFKPSVGKIKAKISEIQAKAPSAAPIVLVETYNNLPDELKDGSTKDSTGIYYKGMVYVIADRITSLDHLVAVWIHENGIHNGLQNVVPGGEFRKLMINVYDSFIEAGKTNKQYQEIIDFVNENYKDENQAGKGEEFLALLAEKIITKRDLSPMDQSVWKKFLTDFRNWIAKLFNFNSNLLSERQIRNIVRASVQSNFQKNEFSSSNQGTSTGTRKRASDSLNGGQGTVVVEPGLYENNAGAGLSDKNRSRGVLSWFGKNESDRSVPLLEILSQAKTTKVQEAEIRRITDRLDNTGDSRPKFKKEGRLNLDGYLQTASQQYQEKKRERRDLKEVFNGIREFYQDHDLPIRRMEEEIKKLGGRIMDSMKPYRDLNLSYGRMEDLFKSFIDDRMKPILKTISAIAKTGMERESVLPYIICKRATELNPKMREKELQQFIEENPEATDAEIQEKEQEIANKDYSGVTGFDPENNFENPDELAQAIVDEFEAQVPAELIDQLWGNIKYATTDIVKAWQKGQMISEEQAEELIMGSKYYVPLRGWREGAAKQLAYVKGEGFSRSMQHAQGRKSFADNPLAYIHKVAFQAIGEQVDNEVKKSLLNLVAGNYGQEFRHIYELKKAYYVKTILDDGSEGWQLSVDPITGEIIRPSEEMFKNGEATTKIYNQYERLRKPSQAREHEVVVKTVTGDMVIVLKGKYLPVAQAMNKRNRMYVSLFTGAIKDASDWTGPAMRTIGNVNNFIKANLTSRNIVFPLTNILRDAPEASLTAFIKGESGTKVIRNMRHASAAFARDLAGKTDPKNKYDQYLKEFRETGGTTGYTHLKDIEQINKDFEKDLRRISRSGIARVANLWSQAGKAINTWSDIFETTTRLAVFISSREAGKTAKESASDAKEYSVNFNRKGKITKALDALYAFFNVSVQSLQKNGSLAYRYPKRFSIVAASFMMAGFLEAMLNDWYTPDDDDDDYYNVNEYVRENYLIFPLPNGKYVRLPLPQFWRSFKSFGSIIYDTAGFNPYSGGCSSGSRFLFFQRGQYLLCFNPYSGGCSSGSQISHH